MLENFFDANRFNTPIQFSTEQKAFVSNTLNDGWVSTAAPHIEKFEAALQNETCYPYCVATNTGTSALLAFFLCLKQKHPNGIILLPDDGYGAALFCAKAVGFEIDFVAVDESTMCISSKTVSSHVLQSYCRINGVFIDQRKKLPIIALVLIHNYGIVPPTEQILDFCREYKIEIIVDAAESLGVFDYHNSFKIDAITSFNGNKIITTGAGGMIFTADKARYEKYKAITTSGKRPFTFDRIIHDSFGMNLRMSGLSAALGLAQIDDLQSRVDFRRSFFDSLDQMLHRVEPTELRLGVDLESIAGWNFWAIPLVVNSAKIKPLAELLRRKNIVYRRAWQTFSNEEANQLNSNYHGKIRQDREDRFVLMS